MPREHRKIERTPEQLAELKATRERFQREKPTRAQLEASGEYGPGMPAVTYFATMAFLKRMRELREAVGLSLPDFAERTGMDKGEPSRKGRWRPDRGRFGMLGIALTVLTIQTVTPIRADDTEKPQRVARIEAGKSVRHVRFSPDGKLVAVIDGREGLVICDTNTRKVQAVFPDVLGSCTSLCFTPDGKSIVMTAVHKVRLIDVTNGESRELYKHDHDADTPVFSTDGSLLATGDEAGQVIVWDYKAGKEAGRFQCKGRVRHMVFMKDGSTLAVGGVFTVKKGDEVEGRYEVWVWDWKNKEIRATLEGIRDPGIGMVLSPDGSTLATLGQRVNEVWLWDTRTNRRRDTYKTESTGVEALAYSADGRMLFAAGGGAHKSPGNVTVWDTASGKRIASFEALNDIIKSLDLSTDGKLMAVSHLGSYGTFELWDVSSLGKLVGKK